MALNQHIFRWWIWWGLNCILFRFLCDRRKHKRLGYRQRSIILSYFPTWCEWLSKAWLAAAQGRGSKSSSPACTLVEQSAPVQAASQQGNPVEAVSPPVLPGSTPFQHRNNPNQAADTSQVCNPCYVGLTCTYVLLVCPSTLLLPFHLLLVASSLFLCAFTTLLGCIRTSMPPLPS